jgi:hypothetical protein
MFEIKRAPGCISDVFRPDALNILIENVVSSLNKRDVDTGGVNAEAAVSGDVLLPQALVPLCEESSRRFVNCIGINLQACGAGLSA